MPLKQMTELGLVQAHWLKSHGETVSCTHCNKGISEIRIESLIYCKD